ncbi:hypothetical protein PIB30_056843 [Stylosanthes scabra]|uniref:Uncharacterized protein n=1 Tax=Stylosanthes scabra TaxID=79078 RepID=A0ABU6ZI51_9FABA|nr:hypothetical protein [Stylosanthes scabra]
MVVDEDLLMKAEEEAHRYFASKEKLEKQENREKQRRSKIENNAAKHDHSRLGVGFHHSPRLGVAHTKVQDSSPKSRRPHPKSRRDSQACSNLRLSSIKV